MDEHLTDQQQADLVRKWLRDNGASLLGGLVLGLGGLMGWNQWQDYKDGQGEQASAVYEDILVAIRTDRSTRADELIADLEDTYGNTPYLDQSRLMMAKHYLERSEFDLAADYLAKVVSDSSSEQVQHIARLRLTRIHLQQRQLEEALVLIQDINAESAFAARYHELRGDIFHAMNRPEEARNEYQAALDIDQQPPVIERVYVQVKLDDLGGAIESGVDAEAVEAGPGEAVDPEPGP